MITFVLSSVLAVIAAGVVIEFLRHPSVHALIYIAAIVTEGIAQACCQGRNRK